MAKKNRFVLNRSGVKQMLKSSEIMGVCEQYASDIVGRLGAGYEVSTHTGRNRVNASVAAVTYKAKREVMENNSILKAVGK
jgi:hypothetical protein